MTLKPLGSVCCDGGLNEKLALRNVAFEIRNDGAPHSLQKSLYLWKSKLTSVIKSNFIYLFQRVVGMLSFHIQRAIMEHSFIIRDTRKFDLSALFNASLADCLFIYIVLNPLLLRHIPKFGLNALLQSLKTFFISTPG